MPWFKVDDKLHDHRKARAAGKAAMGVWVLAGSWAADNLTDGFVPAAILSRWGTRTDAKKLVDVGLWDVAEKDGEKGWQFHQWTEPGRQPTRANVEAERAAARERMANRRRNKAGEFAGSSPEQDANTPGTFAHPDPTRPDRVLHTSPSQPQTPASQPAELEW